MEVTDPYRAPETTVEEPMPGPAALVLANRSTRLAAAIIDELILLVPGIALSLVLPFIYEEVEVLTERGDGIARPVLPASTLFTITVTYFSYLLLNGYLIHATGQTIAKMLFSIRISRPDGSLPGLGRIMIRRALPTALISLIPGVGVLYPFVDVLFIFGKGKRCLHDWIADTIVVIV